MISVRHASPPPQGAPPPGSAAPAAAGSPDDSGTSSVREALRCMALPPGAPPGGSKGTFIALSHTSDDWSVCCKFAGITFKISVENPAVGVQSPCSHII